MGETLMKVRMLAIVTVSLLLGADAKDEATKKVSKDLLGVWKVEKAERNGSAAPADVVAKLSLVFAEDKVTIKEGDGGEEATYKIDASQKPMTLDITPLQGPNANKTAKGIIQLEGDSLKMCWSRPGGERPKEFVTKTGTNTLLFVLKREKK
jgi:uncharacterized protein (TIGR03067 family)